MAFLNGLLGGEAQAPGTASVGGLLGNLGDFFTQQRAQNPAFLDALAGGLVNGGNVPASMAEATDAYHKRQIQDQEVDLRRQGLAQDQSQFDQNYGLQAEEIGMKRQSLASEAQLRRAQQNATADFLEKNQADPALVSMARSGLGGEALKVYQGLKGGNTEYGLSPVYGMDENGNTVVGQLGKDGSIVQSRTPAGFRAISPEGLNQQRASGTATGKSQGEAAADLPSVIANTEQMLKTIQSVQDDPAREQVTGLSGTLDPRNWISGGASSDFKAKTAQLQGSVFLQAFQSLKGGGQITEVEGQKAEAAIARLNTSQSDEGFNTALNDLKEVVNNGLVKAKARAAGGNGPAQMPMVSPILKSKYGLE